MVWCTVYCRVATTMPWGKCSTQLSVYNLYSTLAEITKNNMLCYNILQVYRTQQNYSGLSSHSIPSYIDQILIVHTTAPRIFYKSSLLSTAALYSNSTLPLCLSLCVCVSLSLCVSLCLCWVHSSRLPFTTHFFNERNSTIILSIPLK